MVLDWMGRALSARCSASPIFVVGAGRSGTAVLKRALGAHGSVVSADGESPLLSDIASVLGPLLGDERDYFRSSLRISSTRVEVSLRRLCLEAAMGPHFGLRTLGREIVRKRRRPDRIQRWCAKTFPTESAASCLLELYPSARFVYIVRNGADVVHSRTRFPGMRHLPFDHQCRAWVESVEKYRYLATCPQAVTVRHEDLSRMPEEVFRDLLVFLGLPHEEAPARFVRSTLVHSLDAPTRTDLEVEHLLVERRPGSADWDADRTRTFERICGGVMRELGYEIPS